MLDCAPVVRPLARGRSVSVALATYNGATYLRPQLQSFADQTFLPAELVVSDDNSTDCTLSIIQDFSKIAPFPVTIHRNSARLGYRANFISCAHLCTSDLIAFSDQDDIWAKNKLERQAADFDDTRIMLSCHNADLINSEGTKINRLVDQFKGDCCLDIKTAGPLVFPRGFTQMIRKDIVKWDWLYQQSIDIGELSQKMSHDGWFFFLALLHGLVLYHQEPLVYYRQHASNASEPVQDQKSKLLAKFSNKTSEFQRLVEVWDNRCRMLQTLLDANIDLPLQTRERIVFALAKYAQASGATKYRIGLYDANSIIERVGRLAKSVGRGEYKQNDPWRFPLRGALKDLAFILLFKR